MRKEANDGENLNAKNGQLHASFQDHDLPPKNGPPSLQSIRAFALPPGGLTLNSLAKMKKVAEVVRAVHRLIAVLM
jgi:hypothetical protein